MQQKQSKLRLKERFRQMTGYMKSNKPFSYTLALLLVSLFFLGVNTYQNVYNVLMNDDVINEDAVKIEFHDKNLEREVRNLLERPKDDIYDVDVEKISILTIQNVPVKDIQDLKYFKGLSKLTISSAKITDVSALKDIPYLKELDLSSNQIADVTPLGQINTLQRLTLAGNYIRDMSPLYSLKNLTELNLSGNSIIGVTSDITKLTNLKSLNLSRNRITDNSFFSG
ncbi:MAG: leucine-rich repeat domain-containing protein, partial [Faecalispora jeddahensis]